MDLMEWIARQFRPADEAEDRERARHRLIDQENRVQALDRTVEVIQRTLAEERTHAP